MEIGEDGPERTELRMMYRLLTEIRRHWKAIVVETENRFFS